MSVALKHLQAGARLKADSGFTCIKGGKIVQVARADDGNLYVPCSHGRHYLDGQTNKHGVVVGMTRVLPGE